ncbi:signal peptidase I [Ohessyouella blattaphilus]|uniref:Signal peptidase I n=1 Tax=Ohessyouella blattaphilus TaxID=2949333 RepID=A0ABT1EFN8_9FIRM|nr:signal peptidase I [Ohessyouella blattaphilus]MCP1109522.1 signal peptidase I [Ohessyouella blattaphilus]MCR8562916.1 signal peptidase I [Ohessyouella blattaphilus]
MKKMKTSDDWGLFEWALYIAILAFASWFIVTFIGMRTPVIGQSMESTISDGDQLIVTKFSYRLGEPKRYDVVIFPPPSETDKKANYIKRVIGMPGETIQIMGGYVYINGEQLTTDVYGLEPINPLSEGDLAYQPLTLGEDEYFVLGDNRNNSMDSRNPRVGVKTKADLVGKAQVRIFPFDKISKISKESEQ